GLSDEAVGILQQFKRQALHATRLELTHPDSGELMSWEAPPPPDMQQLLRLLANDD
ncbi:MAG: 23S rRNA pseudouridine(1911/1915/1917) synthase RluD, partial [Candidatus Thiodiazotropha taylori]|nr:23S rRNA pseudouridine(1911/1915/1917) synthase RluD [Candidatus Thiodiazotropha taylori]MCW4255569.1 23S rRNA pseudouridine(1911/1915/1917) synthase RluD [Candidatus Thiodiazotropha taylori]